jgi:RNA polymerase-binding transcription factor DksA
MNLEQIKARLEERLSQLDSRVHAINDDVSHKNNPLSSDWAEQAVERENEEVLEALGNASLTEIRQIKAAIQRIDNGTYTDCSGCGEPIEEQRLKLIISTDLCTPCAEIAEQTQKRA